MAMPGWVRAVLVVLGVQEGSDVIFDDSEDATHLVPAIGPIDPAKAARITALVPSTAGEVPTIALGEVTRTEYIQRRVVGSWVANGVVFYRLDNGQYAVQNKHGVWKVWRPKKPIVLFATGADDLHTLIKADRVIQKQASKLAKTLRNRGYSVKRS
jgi:hypothetical protein